MKKLTKWLSLGAVVVLAGCQSIYNAPTQVDTRVSVAHSDAQWQQHLTQLKAINQYRAKGQFGYIAPDERFSSHFDWNYQSAQNFGLLLSSNLSTKSLTLHRNLKGLTVSDEKGRSRTESDVKALVEEIVGLALPIDQLPFWLKGQPDAQNYLVNEKRQLAQFSYVIDGQTWNASYVEYHEDRQPNLPKLIVLVNGDKTLKIRIDEWIY